MAIATLSAFALLLGDAALRVALAAWLGLALLALYDAAVSRQPLALTVEAPGDLFVGEAGRFRFDLPAAGTALTGRTAWPDGLAGPALFDFAPSADRMQADLTVRAVRRGAWRCEALWVLRPSRLGLFEFIRKLPLDLVVRVVPNIRLVQSGQITATVLSTLYGTKENRAIGDGSEFHQLREFSPGMDIKSIDWKRSAKQRALLAKELRAERNHHVILAIDNGYLMSEAIAGLPKIDHAITAALATAWAAAIGGDLVGWFAYDASPRQFTKPEPGRQAFARLRHWTADLAYAARETNHTLAMSALKARTPKRSLIIVFTDFVDATSAELLIENLSVLNKRHLVLFVAIRDPDLERRLAASPPNLNAVAELVTADLMLRERRLVFERLNRIGVTVIDTKPAEITAQVISRYLEIKARELI
ncbi:MAG: DUF58 domain-containing protein [Pseudomonadota bacterium]